MLTKKEIQRIKEAGDKRRTRQTLEDLGIHVDAGETMFVENELLAVKSATYDVLYPELKANELFPVRPSEDETADEIGYDAYDTVGAAKLLSDHAKDIPFIDGFKTRHKRKVYNVGAGYRYTMLELAAAQKRGVPLDRIRAEMAAKAIAVKLDEIAFAGESSVGIEGAANYTGIDIVGLASVGTWATKITTNPDLVLADINAAVSAIVSGSKGVHRPDSMIVPESQHILLTSTRMANIEMTLINFIMANSPIKNIFPSDRFDGAGVGPTDRILIYTRDIKLMGQEIVKPTEFGPGQLSGYSMEFAGMARTAGVVWNYPKSAKYVDGV